MTPEVDILSVRRTTCRICDSGDLELVLPLAPTPSASAFVKPEDKGQPQPYFPLDVLLCRRCGLVQLADTVDPGYLYAHSWERTSRDSPGMREHFQRYAADLEPFTRDGLNLVEIGSNDGMLLSCFGGRGAKVLGIDPGVDCAKEATARGQETWPVAFSNEVAKQIVQDRGLATLVIANNVIANIDDLPDLAEGIRTLLSQRGVFVFETGSLADLVKHLVFDNIYHEHLSYFSVLPLVKLFADHGLELFHIERVETKGGSLRGFVQHVRGPRPHTTEVLRFLAEEERQALLKPETYKALGCKLTRLKHTLGDLLSDWDGEGVTVAGYGASHSVVTLLHYFDIAHLLDFVADDNPVKHGLYIPGTELLVTDPTTLMADRVPYTVILPWRFAPMIIEKHAGYMRDGTSPFNYFDHDDRKSRGGRFIVPIPEVRIV